MVHLKKQPLEIRSFVLETIIFTFGKTRSTLPGATD